jgi:uncharacterized heparinase superfamily protein
MADGEQSIKPKAARGWLEKLRWYRYRLAAMSVPEIGHRLGESIRRQSDRYFFTATAAEEAKSGMEVPVLPGLREGLELWGVPEELLGEWEESLRQLDNGYYQMLGVTWPANQENTDWHLDPVSGRSWPGDRYCFDINFRHCGDFGDVKYVWELNRLQLLQPVAALACKRHDPAIAERCLVWLDRWIEQNPPYRGLGWSSGIELTMRVVSLLVVTTLLGEWLDEPRRIRLLGCFEAHGRWLHRYPSRFSSGNNHLVAEGLGLFLIGALAPSLPGATGWRAEGWQILQESAWTQLYTDGVGVEQTPSYTAVVLEMLLIGYQVAESLGTIVPAICRERLVRGGEYLRWFLDAAGNHPHIGDDDEAQCLDVHRPNQTPVRSVLGCLAAVANRGDLVPPGLQPHLRQALFGRPPPALPGPNGVRTFAQGGYSVARSRWAREELLLAMDHGPLGFLSIAAHGHADALAVWLHLGEQPILVDAGTYLYHSGRTWRDYFRGTAAHNTLRVEGQDSSLISGPFNWSHKAVTRLLLSDTTPEGGCIVEAEHDGYQNRFGVVHRRRLELVPDQAIRITDRLISDRIRRVEINFLLHPALRLTAGSNEFFVLTGERVLFRVLVSGPLRARAILPGTTDEGWYSPSFSEKIPAPRLLLEGDLAPGQEVETVFLKGGN